MYHGLGITVAGAGTASSFLDSSCSIHSSICVSSCSILRVFYVSGAKQVRLAEGLSILAQVNDERTAGFALYGVVDNECRAIGQIACTLLRSVADARP